MTRPRPDRARPAAILTFLAAALSALVSLAPAASASTGQPIGGPQLGSPGLVVDPAAPALPQGITAKGWLLADADTGDVLAARDPHGGFTPASTLKLLTAVTELPRLDPGRLVRPDPADLIVDGNKAPLDPGTSYPVKDLFAYLILRSANDAANVIAHLDGSRADTLARMNAQARRLHADDTRAMTPNGLDAPSQQSSAYDLALIGRAALAIPELARLAGTSRMVVTGDGGRPRTIVAENKLLERYPGAIGMKTGYTVRSGGTFVGAARRGGHTLILTLLHATPHYYPEAEHLLDWGFAALGHVHPVGTLVSPQAARAVAAGRAPLAASATAVPASALPRWATVVAWFLGGFAALLVGLRVRAVRRRRARQRRARHRARRPRSR